MQVLTELGPDLRAEIEGAAPSLGSPCMDHHLWNLRVPSGPASPVAMSARSASGGEERGGVDDGGGTNRRGARGGLLLATLVILVLARRRCKPRAHRAADSD